MWLSASLGQLGLTSLAYCDRTSATLFIKTHYQLKDIIDLLLNSKG